MTTPIRCGVAGVGYLGQHHARIYNELEQCTLAGIYDIDPDRAAEVAGKHGTTAFVTLEELAQACDAVSVVVPTPQHCEVALRLLDAGAPHLLIEKPICSTLAEAEQILLAAKAKDRLIQVGHIEQYNPVMDYLERTVDSPRFITADRLAPFNPRGSEVGVVLDLMIHDIGVIQQIVGSPVERVESVGVQVLTRHEDIANARITFANGCVANINTSRVSEKKVREIRVFQPATYLSIDFMKQQGHLMRLTPEGLNREDIPINQGEPLMLELASFIDCIHRREDPKVSGERGRGALDLAIQITEQIKSAAVTAG